MLTESGDTPAYRLLARFNSIILEQSNQTCMDYSYDAEIESLRNDSLSPEGSMYIIIILFMTVKIIIRTIPYLYAT